MRNEQVLYEAKKRAAAAVLAAAMVFTNFGASLNVSYGAAKKDQAQKKENEADEELQSDEIIGEEEVARMGAPAAAADENGDGIPDQNQVRITYRVKNGSLSIQTPVYVTLYREGNPELGYGIVGEKGVYGKLNRAQIPQALPNEGINPDSEVWTLDGKMTARPTEFSIIKEDRNYLISFNEPIYRFDIVRHYYDSEGVETSVESLSGKALCGTRMYDLSEKAINQSELYQGKTYILTGADGAERQICDDPVQNRLDLHYQLDMVGESCWACSDGIPDQNQIMFKYRSSDPLKGCLAGEWVEVKTRPMTEDGRIDMETPIYPDARIWEEGRGDYKLSHWSDGSVHYNDAKEIRLAGYYKDTTFTGYFTQREEPDLSVAFSKARRTKSEHHGGEAIHRLELMRGRSIGYSEDFIPIVQNREEIFRYVIDRDAIPKAALPDDRSGDVIIQDDGECPFAAIPKVGEPSIKSTISNVFAGFVDLFRGNSRSSYI